MRLHESALVVRSLGDTLLNSTCQLDNADSLDNSSVFEAGALHFSAHVIGWLVAGGCAFLTCLISGCSVWLHARNYRKPFEWTVHGAFLEQRQIIRILLMPPLFAIISVLGYRWYREFIYFKAVRDTYEAFTIAAFLILMLLYISDSPIEQRELLSQKEKRKLVFPLCCWRYRPSKPYFIFTVKWSVMQFVVVKPLLAAATIVTEAMGFFCASSQSFLFANVYIEILDFICVTIALYGLVTLYSLTKEELEGHRPLAKFATIKIIVALVFYQSFIFNILQRYGMIKGTKYWTATNVSDGLNSLAITVEMILIALFQLYAFPYTEFKLEMPDDRVDSDHTRFWRSFLHSQDYRDFMWDIFYSFKFFFDSVRGKPYTKSQSEKLRDGGNNLDFGTVFAPSAAHQLETMDSKIGDPQRPYLLSTDDGNGWAMAKSEDSLARYTDPFQDQHPQPAMRVHSERGREHTDGPTGGRKYKPLREASGPSYVDGGWNVN